ncbi:unnamed protein product [Ilex paraguariensis]|uniref:protein-serine/threonine phosphatase n=1 Tax=Ilex paraguariensis TaxID=185542 RepID=A0ABC8TLY4_9AQUA
MSLITDSPVHSSSSDDFAAFLDTELGSPSDMSPEEEEEDDVNDYDSDLERIKRHKVEVLESVPDSDGSTSHVEPTQILEMSVKKDVCMHPGDIRGMCIRCGQKINDESGVAFGYIHKDLRLANDEVARLRDKDLKHLLSHKKLYLVLDLDHTLLNSARLLDITPDVSKGSLFKLEYMRMLTKLRPFVRTFLKEASNLFEMYIYTHGERAYALEMAKLLDPGNVYFNSRVISQSDSTQRHQKRLDVVLGQESAVLILDDTEQVRKLVCSLSI